MLKDVIAVKPIKDYQLHLTFEDGKEGIIDLAEIIEFSGIAVLKIMLANLLGSQIKYNHFKQVCDIRLYRHPFA